MRTALTFFVIITLLIEVVTSSILSSVTTSTEAKVGFYLLMSLAALARARRRYPFVW